MILHFTDEQQQALAAYMRRVLDAKKYRFAPGLLPIKEVPAMLEPARAPKPAQSSELPSRPIRQAALEGASSSEYHPAFRKPGCAKKEPNETETISKPLRPRSSAG